MNAPILRPIFNENDILSAADVNGIVDHARNATARHNRYLHEWGIAAGLELETESPEDGFVEITLSPGLAIDGTGREIVVAEPFRLSEDVFDQLNVAESTADLNNPPKYPVFIFGRDQPQPSSAMAPSVCLPGEPNRTAEGFEVTFGRVGDAVDLDLQPAPELGRGVSSATRSSWKILLGFVEWDGEHFTAAHEESDGVARRYVGVKAEQVVGPNGSLTLRSASHKESDKAALVIDNQNDGEMRFGLQDSNGKVVPVFTVNAKGDVIAEGKILGAIAGGVQIESGVITDGALVPLPAGITQQQIDNGEATIQIHLSPRYQQPALLPGPAPGEHWVTQPLECFADGRRVVCQVLWYQTTFGGGVPMPMVLPGVCDYQVFGFVKE